MSPISPFADNRVPFLIGATALLIIAGYSLFVALPYLRGPALTVTSPLNMSTVGTPVVHVTGTTERVQYLSVDDQPVALAPDGSFDIVRAYPAGYTVLRVVARDRFNRERSVTITFINTYKPHVP